MRYSYSCFYLPQLKVQQLLATISMEKPSLFQKKHFIYHCLAQNTLINLFPQHSFWDDFRKKSLKVTGLINYKTKEYTSSIGKHSLYTVQSANRNWKVRIELLIFWYYWRKGEDKSNVQNLRKSCWWYFMYGIRIMYSYTVNAPSFTYLYHFDFKD